MNQRELAQRVSELLAAQIATVVREGMSEVVRMSKKQKEVVAKGEETLAKRARSVEKARKNCRCKELADREEALQDARVQHEEVLARNRALEKDLQVAVQQLAQERKDH